MDTLRKFLVYIILFPTLGKLFCDFNKTTKSNGLVKLTLTLLCLIKRKHIFKKLKLFWLLY